MMNKIVKAINKFVDGDFTINMKRKKKPERIEATHHEKTIDERAKEWHDKEGVKVYKGLYTAASVAICLIMITILLITVSFLPPFGNPNNPVNNEVSQRYIEKGLEETGAVNIVSGMILDYRAFDTLGESTVLFTAATSVMLLLKKEKKGKEINDKFSPKRDPIVKNTARFVIPILLVFGIYIVLNGHLSPGGGFSGGGSGGGGGGAW